MATSGPATPDDDARPNEFVQSLARGLSVIRAFTADKPELTLSDVAGRTGLSRAAARRFLLTLESLGYIDSNGRLFHLRPSVLDLGYAYLSSLSLADIADAHLHLLSGDLHESCSASVLDNGDIVHIARAASSRLMAVRIDLGRRIPAYVTAMGRVLLASLSDDDLTAYFHTYDRPQLNVKTSTDEEHLRGTLLKARQHGYAIVDQELEHGIRSIAVPIRDPRGVVVAAINSSAHASRVSVAQLRQHFLPRLREAAAAIEHDLVAARK
jgi:IclR family pca regulon transcriptional regulator